MGRASIQTMEEISILVYTCIFSSMDSNEFWHLKRVPAFPKTKKSLAFLAFLYESEVNKYFTFFLTYSTKIFQVKTQSAENLLKSYLPLGLIQAKIIVFFAYQQRKRLHSYISFIPWQKYGNTQNLDKMEKGLGASFKIIDFILQ